MENKFDNFGNKEQREKPSFYSFAVLDPRPIPAAREHNDQVFESNNVYGIEVTVPELAERCVVNIDPQHTGGDSDTAAIEEAVIFETPPQDALFATVRADLDSVGAMAVFTIRSEDGVLDDAAMERVKIIADSDKFAQGGYLGPKPLPTQETLWNNQNEEVLAAIAAEISDFKVPLADRVASMKEWLKTGNESEIYRKQVHEEKLDMVKALENGDITYETRADGRIAFVESTHRAGTTVGYSLAPVVVALNPSFKQHGKDPYKKFTVCTFEKKFADIKAALMELNELEPGWGGSPTIGGSPQGVDSQLSVDQVVSIVEKHLKE